MTQKIRIIIIFLLVLTTNNSKAQWDHWDKYADNPVYVHNTEGAWNVASDPAVIFEGDTFRMIVSGDRGTLASGTGDGNSIIMAVSGDGYNWATLQNGQNGVVVQGYDEEWDESMELPELIKVGNTYRIFYCGYDPEVRDSSSGLVWGDLGMAESTDGIHFIKSPAPVMTRTPGWYDQDGITDPTIVEKDDTLFMIYVGWCTRDCALNSGNPAFYSLKAFSVDSGKTWTKQGLLEASGTAYQHADLELNPDSTYSLFYGVDNDCSGSAIGIYRAIGNTPYGPFVTRCEPIFCMGTQAFEYSGMDGGFPSVVNNMGKAMLYYTGIDEANWYFRIGLAESRTVFDTVTVFDTIRVSVYDTVTVCDTVYVLGIKNEYYNQDLIVYPNPAKDLVTVEGNSQDLISLKVFNVHGQDCTEKTSILDQNNQSIVFDISHLPPGAYVIKSETAAVVLYKP